MSPELLRLAGNSLSVPMETAGCIMCGSPCSEKALEVGCVSALPLAVVSRRLWAFASGPAARAMRTPQRLSGVEFLTPTVQFPSKRLHFS